MTYAQFGKTIQVLSAFGLIWTIISFVLYYSFRKQRRFPTSIIGWQLPSNAVAMILVIYIVYGNSGIVGSSSTTAQSGSAECRLVYALDNAFFTWDICCNTLFALTLHLSVYYYVALDYKTNPKYYRGFIAFAVIWTFVSSVIAAGLPQLPGVCTPKNSYRLIIVIPNLCLLCIQLGLLARTSKRIMIVTKAARMEHCNKEDKRMMLLILRVIPTIIAEFLQVLPQYVIEFVAFNQASTGDALINQTETVYICECLAIIIDATVLFVTNRGLWRRVLNNKNKGTTSSETQSTSQGATTEMSLKETPSVSSISSVSSVSLSVSNDKLV